MLRIFDRRRTANCQGFHRRELLRVGALGLGGLSLPHWLAARATADSAVRAKSVVVLFLGGGPPQHETFDPKMSAPSAYRAMFGEIPTALPGVTFGSHFQELAKLADRLSVVRCYRNGLTSHGPATATVIAGDNPTKAMLGSVYARVAGSTNAQTGMPNGASFRGNPDYTQRLGSPGTLGPAYRPFDPSGGGELKKNMELRIDRRRLDDRRALLTALDQLKRRAETERVFVGADRFRQQAFDVLLGGVTKAFEWEGEDPRVIARYDTSDIKVPQAVLQKKNKPGFAEQSPEALGKQMLLARRLVQAGCGFVTVTSTGWDLHGNRFGVDDGMPVLGVAADRAAAAFIEDLERLGMSDDVLLVITGEFGRTPKINNKAGRDHWGRICPLVFAGGGLPMGQVIGYSDRLGGAPAADPVGVPELSATILHTLLDAGRMRLNTDIPVEIRQTVDRAQPILS
ncbi:MAG: DUF1501 domain-containing protein [Pirellulaceae bacterium]|jgi:hypothetical protein|nr:DUF1501 domain-containing protein [Pirellulaceae bacterium]